MTILLLRHASAGPRDSWFGDDRSRPLDGAGRRQARELVAALGAYDLTRIVTSPYLRCSQTVEPLAAHLGLPVETRDELAEHSRSGPAGRLLRGLLHETAVACTHADVIVTLLGADRRLDKGAAWVLEPDGSSFVPTAYLPPP